MARMNWDRVNRERNLPDYSERFDAAEARLREGAAQRMRERSAARSGATSSAATSSTTAKAGSTTGATAKKARKKKQKKAAGATPVQNRPVRSGLGIVSVPPKKPNRKKRTATQPLDSSALRLHRMGGLVRSGSSTIRQLERQDANARRRQNGAQKPKTRAEREAALAQKREREQAAAARANISVEELREQRRAKAREDKLLADEAKALGLTTKQLRAQRAAENKVDRTRP